MPETVSQLQVVISADTAELTRGLSHASQQVSSFGDSLKQGLGIGAGLAVVQTGLAAVGQTFGALKSSVIDFNQQLDQSRAIFTRFFEGNSQLAESFLNTLKSFAATTPFEFKDLSTLAVRLQNANTNANDIIPTLKAIGNAASATGNLSQESVGRITTALTQMQMRTKVSAEEMMQLTEAGVPAWNILAEATGKPIPHLMKMVTAGEIASSTFITAFRGMYQNAGLMEGASKSLAGAWSTIRDVGTQAFADIGRSIYDLATQGANALARFLSSEEFQAWVIVAKTAVDAVIGSIQSLIAALAPVGEVIATAFRQLTQGDFAGAFSTITTAIQQAFAGALEAVQAFAGRMFGAGQELVGEYASGILAGASGALQAAIDAVTSTIAAFLIGQSPPPEGPLANIAKGGAATITAWGQGAADATDAAVKPVAEKIAGNIGELKIAGRDADAAIRDISQSIRDVESASRDLKYSADDIKDAYDDQVEAIDTQIKAVKEVHDVERDREKLELSLEEIQLRQAEVAAMGNKELRAQLQARLATLKASTDERKNAEALADADKALAGSQKDRLKAQLDAQKLVQQERDIRERMKKAKGPEKERLQAQLEELELRKKIDAEEAKEREAANKRRLADAQGKKSELDIQGQIAGLVDKEGLAAIKTRQDAIKGRRDEIGLVEQTEKLEREIALGPLQAQRAALIADRDAMLKPLQEQLETLNRQKASLGEQRSEMQAYKADISSATAGLKDQEAAIKATAKAAKEAALTAPTPGVNKTFTPDALAEAATASAKKAGENLATAFRDAFTEWFAKLVPKAIKDRLKEIADDISARGIPALVEAIGSGIAAAVPVLANRLALWVGAYLDWAATTQSKLLERLAILRERYIGWIQGVVPAIASTLVGWTSAFLTWATTTWPPLREKLTTIASGMLAWMGEHLKVMAGQLLDWATAFIAWVGPVIPELLAGLGEMAASMIEWLGRTLGELLDGLGAWALAFVEWVAPKIPPLLRELGALLVDVTDWIIRTALPAIAGKLLEWGSAIVNWVAPRIEPLILELIKLNTKMMAWIIETALPAIVGKLAEWGLAFLTWVAETVIPYLAEKLDAIQAAISTWVGQKIEDVKTSAAELGAAMIEGIRSGIANALDGFTNWLKENFIDKIPKTIRDILGLDDDSGVLARVGERMVDELKIGIRNRWPSLEDLWSRLSKSVGFEMGEKGDSGGKVRRHIIEAAAEREIDPSVALRIAHHEGGEDDYMRIGKFDTGWSFWPFQLHYGGKGYEYFGDTAGMGTGFTQKTDWQPGDWRAWKDSIDYALDVARRHGWSQWYGRKPAGVGAWEGIPGHAAGGWVGLQGPELGWLGERGPEYVVPHSAMMSGGAVETVRVEIAVGDRVAEEIYVTGRQLAIRRGRVSSGVNA